MILNPGSRSDPKIRIRSSVGVISRAMIGLSGLWPRHSILSQPTQESPDFVRGFNIQICLKTSRFRRAISARRVKVHNEVVIERTLTPSRETGRHLVLEPCFTASKQPRSSTSTRP